MGLFPSIYGILCQCIPISFSKFSIKLESCVSILCLVSKLSCPLWICLSTHFLCPLARQNGHLFVFFISFSLIVDSVHREHTMWSSQVLQDFKWSTIMSLIYFNFAFVLSKSCSCSTLKIISFKIKFLHVLRSYICFLMPVFAFFTNS